MPQHTHSVRLKVLAGLFAFLANVSLLQQVPSGGPGDAWTILTAAVMQRQGPTLTRAEARARVRSKLTLARQKNASGSLKYRRGVRLFERYRRARPSVQDVPPPDLSIRDDGPERSRCGDQIVLLSETCDDGNTQSDDGCSSDCKTEAGFTCYGQPSVCIERCGDGNISLREKCDDGNLDNSDGCSDQCRIEFGFSCTGTPSTCTVNPVCGNRAVETPETCDDGNLIAGDGCSAYCTGE